MSSRQRIPHARGDGPPPRRCTELQAGATAIEQATATALASGRRCCVVLDAVPEADVDYLESSTPPVGAVDPLAGTLRLLEHPLRASTLIDNVGATA